MSTDLTREREGYNADDLGLPEDTAPAGILCANHPRDLTPRIRHENTAAVRACYAVGRALAAEQAGELYAEAAMSWVCGGGNPADASRYASVIAAGGTWDGGISHEEFSGQLCGHGLALELCADPVNHYPPDM
jgi:hypothetical protein